MGSNDSILNSARRVTSVWLLDFEIGRRSLTNELTCISEDCG